MTVTFFFISVFAVLINKVCLQVTVEGVIGESVVLPCASTEDAHLQDINVNWRHNNSENVFNLWNGKDSLSEQNPRYKNRAESFPDEYLKRNFSIKLNKLQHTDAGDFTCYISHASEQKSVRLLVRSKSVSEKEQGDQGDKTSPGGVGTSGSLMWLYIALPLLLLIIIVSALVYVRFRSKRISGPL